MTNGAPETLTTIVTITEKGTGVIHALRRAFPELGSSRIFAIAKDACAELKGKIRKGDICAVVLPGQVIKIPAIEKINPPQDQNKWEDASGKYERAIFDGKPTGAIAYRAIGASNNRYLYPNSSGVYVGFEHIPQFKW